MKVRSNRWSLHTVVASLAMAGMALGLTPQLAAAAEEKHEQSPLESSMEKIAASYKQLARAFRAPNEADIDEYLKHAKKLKEEAVKSRKQVPAKLAALPEAQKTNQLKAYQKDMDTTIKTLDALVKALTERDLAQATTLVGKLKEQRTKGHEKYKADD